MVRAPSRIRTECEWRVRPLPPLQVPLCVSGQPMERRKGQYPFEERLAIVKQVIVGRFIVEIDGDSAVVPRLCGGCGQCVTPRSSGLVR
jgi:hypothetical protein